MIALIILLACMVFVNARLVISFFFTKEIIFLTKIRSIKVENCLSVFNLKMGPFSWFFLLVNDY